MVKTSNVPTVKKTRFADGKTEWQVRWTLLGRPTLLWLIAVFLAVPAFFELLFYYQVLLGWWSWGVAYLFAAGSLMVILRRCEAYFSTFSRIAGLLFATYTLAGVALVEGAWHALWHSPIVTQKVEEITDWRSVRFVEVQQPMLDYDHTKTDIDSRLYKHSYSIDIRYRVPMDAHGWVYLDENYHDSWPETDDVQHEQQKAAFINHSKQHFDSSDFAYARFFSVEAAPKERGGYPNQANLHAHFMSFAQYRAAKLGVAGVVFLVFIIGWYVVVRRETLDKRAYTDYVKRKGCTVKTLT